MGFHSLCARRQDNRWQTLDEHCRNVAKFMTKRGETIGLAALFHLCGLLHDLGKASPSFQAYLEADDPSLRGTVIHSLHGALYVLQHWGRRNDPVSVLLAVAIASHHGKLPDLVTDQGRDYLSTILSNDRLDDLEETVFQFAQQVAPETELENLYHTACAEFQVYLHSLVKTCVDIEKTDQQIAIQYLLGITQRALFGALIDADRWDAYCFEAAEPSTSAPPPWCDWEKRLESKLGSFAKQSEIDRLRAGIADECLQCASHGAGVYRLNVPTGGGKTFSSLRFALTATQQTGMERIVYAAPYKTILEQTARVFRETLGHEEQILEHHSDVSFGPDEGEAFAHQQLLSERWNAPLILTTTVQLLNTLFAGRSAAVRRFPALSRCVIILDEVQCIPVRCWYMLTLAIRWLAGPAGCAVVLCTATQPMWEKLPSFHLPPTIRMVKDESLLYKAFKRVNVVDRTLSELSLGDLAADVADTLDNAGSALCIMNTKKCALALYKAMKEALPDNVVLYCLTTLQCPAHRLQLLDEIRARLKAGKPLVCVATQLIEAGVDVSFGLTVRALAGLENLAQAAGRCNRNGERESGEVWLVRVAGENLGSLSEIRSAQSETRSVLDDYRINKAKYRYDLLSPEAMERYFQAFIRENAAQMKYPDPGRKDGCNLLDLLSVDTYNLKAFQDFHNDQPYNGLMVQAYRQAGNTFRALESPTTPVVVPWGEGQLLIEALQTTQDIKTIHRVLRVLQRYTVAVFDGDFRALQANHALSLLNETGVWVADRAYYDQTLGLSTDRKEMDFWGV